MAVFIGSNTITPVEKRLEVDQCIREAIGDREGAWRVSLAEVPDKQTWKLVVKGPDGFQLAEEFDGKDCTPSHVCSRLRQTLEKSDKDLSSALADLVKEGVLFTKEIRDDGTDEYFIDRVRLTGEEVMVLRKHGALTRRGIQHYLAARR